MEQTIESLLTLPEACLNLIWFCSHSQVIHNTFVNVLLVWWFIVFVNCSNSKQSQYNPVI